MWKSKGIQVGVEHHFPVLSSLTVRQNCLKADQQIFWVGLLFELLPHPEFLFQPPPEPCSAYPKLIIDLRHVLVSHALIDTLMIKHGVHYAQAAAVISVKLENVDLGVEASFLVRGFLGFLTIEKMLHLNLLVWRYWAAFLFSDR